METEVLGVKPPSIATKTYKICVIIIVGIAAKYVCNSIFSSVLFYIFLLYFYKITVI